MTDTALALRPPWPAVFALMWEAYLAGTVPVGAVIADDVGSVVARGRNRIFTAAGDGHLGGTRLAHAEINALVSLSSAQKYPELTLYSSLEPCHLCLAAATMVRVGALWYAGTDRYAGAVGRLLPSEFTRQQEARVSGPLPGLAGLFPELLHLRHMLWRVPGRSGVEAFYRRERPDLVELALRLPGPPEATTLLEALGGLDSADSAP